MPGAFGAPYRAPCGGWPSPRRHALREYDHRRNNEKHIQVYINDTKVPDWQPADDSCFGTTGRHYAGGGIAPYSKLERFPAGGGTGGTCPDLPLCGPADGVCIPPCGQWNPLDAITANTVDHNHYSALAGVYIDMSVCRKGFFKNVQAVKAWHGRFGFNSHDPSGCADTVDMGAGCSHCSFEAEQFAPDGTKYLRIRREATAAVSCWDFNGVHYTSSASKVREYRVDRWSGKVTEIACADTDVGLNGSCDNFFACSGFDDAGTFLDGFGLDAYCGRLIADPGHGSATITNTTISWADNFDCSTPFGPAYIHASSTITLSEPYTAAQVRADLVMLLAFWDLTKDTEYPFRHDGFTSVAPLVSYNENPSPQTPDNEHSCGFVDTGGWTNDVIGKPNPAGYQSHFDYSHITWARCTEGEDFGGALVWYKKGYGAYSGQTNLGDATDAAMPPTATRWTDNYLATFLMPGAWMMCGGITGRDGTPWPIPHGVCMAQKWCETQVRRPSWNFQRPCGPDLYLFDEPTVRCVKSFAAGTITLSSASSVLTGAKCLVCGVGGGADGLWYVTRTDGTHFILSSFVGSVPARTDCGSGVFGQVRFEHVRDCSGQWYDDKPKGDYLYAEWQFNHRDFYERDRVNAQYITCGSCVAAAPANAAVIRPNQSGHGMPRAVSNLTIISNCLIFNPCCPSVICISPNGEKFQNGTTFDSFSNFTPDERYGAQWQSAPIQHMQDLIWQAPHGLCVDCSPDPKPTVCGWKEDTGGCAEDSCPDDCDSLFDVPTSAYYYPQRPWVEARQSIPTGAPPLGVGTYIGYLTLSQLNQMTPPSGNVLPPPLPPSINENGSIIPSATPWTIYLTELTCVCADGRFATEYKANGVKC